MTEKLLKFLEFFRASSSQRIAFLTSLPFVYLGTIDMVHRLIKTNNAPLAVEIWGYFYLLVALFGGLISLKMIQEIFAMRTKAFQIKSTKEKKTKNAK
jgi:hypothetical protein